MCYIFYLYNQHFSPINSYILSFLWGISILLSFIGWGGIIQRFLFPNYRIDWGQKAAWGVAIIIFIGSILNVTWMISVPAVILLILSGLVYYFFDLLENKFILIESLYIYINRYRDNRFLIFSSFIVFALAFINYSAFISDVSFVKPEDYTAYFVFPKKMLQIGSMEPDPFSERRLFELGGQSFLHTLTLSILSENNYKIIDPGIAIIVVIGLIHGFCKEKNNRWHNKFCCFYFSYYF